MSDKAGRLTCQFIGIVTFVLAFNYFSESQQWGASIGLGFLSIDLGISTFLGACIVGLPVVGTGLLLFCVIGSRYAKSKCQTTHWDERVPIKMPGVSVGQGEARSLAAISIIGFVAFPLYCVWHFFRKMLKYGTVCDTKADEGRLIGLWSNPGDFILYDNRFRVGIARESCTGVTFEPLVQPLLMLALASICTIGAAIFCRRIFAPSCDA